MEKDKTEKKKKKVIERNNELDTNNNTNLPQRPLIEKDGKILRDDGFEHRKSEDTK